MPAKPKSRVLVGLALLAGAAGCGEPIQPRPHVLLITLDATRADALSCYGAPVGSTPVLDALAAEGVRFDLALSTAALTPVAHASILTGLDTWRHGVRVMSAESGCTLPDGVPTLASLLEAQGWRTAAFHSSFAVSERFGLERGFELLESFDADMDQGEPGHPWDVETFQRRSDATTDLVLAHLREAGDEPSLLWVHYWDPHDPGRIPPRELLPQAMPRGPDGALLSSPSLYAAEVRYMDSQIGRLLEELRTLGRLEDTLVVVVGDHGQGLGDHGWDSHRVLYQEQLRVPFLMRLPASLGEVERPVIDEVVSLIDVLPTMLDYLGVEAPPVSGRSLRPLVEGARQQARVVFADAVNGYDLQSTVQRERPHEAFGYCATDGRFKLIYRPAHPERSELFDLQTDPGEQHDRFQERPDQVLRFLRELATTGAWVSAPFAAQGASALEAKSPRAGIALPAVGPASAGTEPSAPWSWAWVCPLHPNIHRAEATPCRYDKEFPVLIAQDAALFARQAQK